MDNDKCSAHRLNLSLTSDLKNLNKSITAELSSNEVKEYRAAAKKINNVINKCLALFKKQTSSSKSSDNIKDVLGILLTVPSSIRWKSLFDSLKHLLKILDSKATEVSKLFEIFNLKKLSVTEMKCLQEYVQVIHALKRLFTYLLFGNFRFFVNTIFYQHINLFCVNSYFYTQLDNNSSV